MKLGALAATDGSDLAWQQTVACALDAGWTADEVVDAWSSWPVIGRTRIMAAPPRSPRDGVRRRGRSRALARIRRLPPG